MVCYWQRNISRLFRKWANKVFNQVYRSSLCDYSDACILVTENVKTTPNNNATQVASKNWELFKDCRQINDTFVDYAGFINIAMPM